MYPHAGCLKGEVIVFFGGALRQSCEYYSGVREIISVVQW
jgi:hypothetical protein